MRGRSPRGTALVILAAASVLVSACGTSGNRSGAASGGTVLVGHGVTLKATRLPAGVRASVLAGTVPPGRDGAGPLSPAYRLTPSGPLPALTTVVLPLRKPVPAGEQVLVAEEESAAGPWSYLPGRLTDGRRAVTFQTSHFSVFAGIGVGLDTLASAFKKNFVDVVDSGLSASAAPPGCLAGAAARAAGFSVASTPSNAVYWCLGMSGTQRVLKVVDNRQYPMELSHPDLTVASLANPPGLSSLSRAYSGGYTILEPGGEAAYNVRVPANAIGGVATQADVFGEDMYALQTGLTALAAIVSRLGLEQVTGGLKLLTAVVGDASCASALSQGVTAMLAGCLDADELGEVFGSAALGVILAAVIAVTSVVQFFRSEFDVSKDRITGADRYYVAITHRAVAVPPAAPCTPAAVQAGVQAAVTASSGILDDIHGFGCSGNFAYAFADVTAEGNENSETVLLIRQADTWAPADRATYCPDHSVPPPIYVNACETQ